MRIYLFCNFPLNISSNMGSLHSRYCLKYHLSMKLWLVLLNIMFIKERKFIILVIYVNDFMVYNVPIK